MKIIFFTLALIYSTFSFSQTELFFKQANEVFSTYVKEGRVDYNAIKADPSKLDKVLELASKVNASSLSANTNKAFWINAYNLAVFKGVVTNYPIKTPIDVTGFFDGKKYNLGGVNITLNDIENKKLRAKYPKEARFHFVLVCAGLGCPPIINKAYTPEELENLLQQQTVKALNNPDFIKVANNKVYLSEIFKWYNKDFTQSGSVLDYVNRFRENKINTSYKTAYYTYDWTLNKQ